MLSKRKQEAYINKRIENIKTQFSHFCTDQDAEAIHQLRVELKKLRAILNLINKCHHSKKTIQSFKGLEKLFKEAGEIRRVQIMNSTVERYQISKENTETIASSNTQQLITELIDKQKDYIDKIEQFERKFKHSLTDIQHKKIKSIIKKNIKKLHHTFTKGGSESDLHASRKKIKSLIYIQSVLPKRLVRELNFDLNYLKEIENEIGEWNDLLDFQKIALAIYEEDNPIIIQLKSQIQQSLFYIYLLTFKFKDSVYLKKKTSN